MKALFNNAWFIIGLGVFGLIFSARSLLAPLIGSGENFDDVDVTDWQSEPSVTEESIIGNTALVAVDTSQLFWNPHPRRDPFSPNIYIKKQELSQLKGQANTKLGDISFRRPELSAVVAGETSRFAVLDGQIVKEGDYISGYQIKGILRDGVWIQNAQGAYKLGLSELSH